jgi:autotransporter strand-loop-strand O-heptosyltransferase
MKILYVAPHLSTGGMPQYLYALIAHFYKEHTIEVVDVTNSGGDSFVVQKNKISNAVPIHTLNEKSELLDVINIFNPEIIHYHEVPQTFLPINILNKLFKEDRIHFNIVTTHSSFTNPDEILHHPDKYVFVSEWSKRKFDHLGIPSIVWEYPIYNHVFNKEYAQEQLELDPTYKHVLHIGLFTSGKNQGELFEIARQLEKYKIKFHFVGNQAGNFKDYWEPLMENKPDNCIVWGERYDVDTFYSAVDLFYFPSKFELSPIAIREALSYNLPCMFRKLDTYLDMYDNNPNVTYITDNIELNKQLLLNILQPKNIKMYNDLKKNPNPIIKIENKISFNFVDGAFVEVLGNDNTSYLVKFINDDTEDVVYQTTINNNCWARTSIKYFINWRIEIYQQDVLIFHHLYDAKDKTVLISFDSSSLGDTIAWISYILEFKKKHNCHIVVSTFHNNLFETVYPELKFVNPGLSVLDIYAQYNLGWYYDVNKEPALPNTVKLQQAATNILGLDFQEIKPRILHNFCNKYKGKIVTIATNSTAGCKFWTKEGWQEVINFLSDQGYRVINVSKEDNPFERCDVLDDKSLQNAMDAIASSEFFIGLSSGLSWLAWGLGKKVVMISNFSEKDHEFECIRITNTNVCHGCWNNPEFKFDKGDWNWCPINRGTSKQFECQKSITSKMVIDNLKNHI